MIRRFSFLELLGLLARGGQSEVYLARSGSNIFIVKKSLLQRDLVREFSCLAALRHPNIVLIKGFFFCEHSDALVLSYAGSFSLRMLLNELATRAEQLSLSAIDYVASLLFCAVSHI